MNHIFTFWWWGLTLRWLRFDPCTWDYLLFFFFFFFLVVSWCVLSLLALHSPVCCHGAQTSLILRGHRNRKHACHHFLQIRKSDRALEKKQFTFRDPLTGNRRETVHLHNFIILVNSFPPKLSSQVHACCRMACFNGLVVEKKNNILRYLKQSARSLWKESPATHLCRTFLFPRRGSRMHIHTAKTQDSHHKCDNPAYGKYIKTLYTIGHVLCWQCGMCNTCS